MPTKHTAQGDTNMTNRTPTINPTDHENVELAEKQENYNKKGRNEGTVNTISHTYLG